MYLIPADRAADQDLARGWSQPGHERSLPGGRRAPWCCEIRHYAPATHSTSPSGCHGAALLTAGQPQHRWGLTLHSHAPSSWVHLQVRGGIAWPWVRFQAPAANKTLCQGTFTLSALAKRDRVPVVLPEGGTEGWGSWKPWSNPVPCCILPPKQAHLPLPLQPHPSFPVMFSYCSLGHCSFSRAGISACVGSVML